MAGRLRRKARGATKSIGIHSVVKDMGITHLSEVEDGSRLQELSTSRRGLIV